MSKTIRRYSSDFKHDAVQYVYSHPILLYDYQVGRSSDIPREFLKGYRGVLVTDGYQVYHKLANERPDELKVAGCWAHCKRMLASG